MSTKALDLSGYDNGYVRVLEIIETRHLYSNRSYRIWRCRCYCGKEMKLTTLQIRECIPKGCCFKQKRPGNKYKHAANTKHGLKKHPLYSVWQGMKGRCYRQKHISYKYYGSKGITVCDRWKNDFKTFYDWCMEKGWAKGLTIDRIDSSKNYDPNNCQLITHSENSKRQFNKPTLAQQP